MQSAISRAASRLSAANGVSVEQPKQTAKMISRSGITSIPAPKNRTTQSRLQSKKSPQQITPRRISDGLQALHLPMTKPRASPDSKKKHIHKSTQITEPGARDGLHSN